MHMFRTAVLSLLLLMVAAAAFAAGSAPAAPAVKAGISAPPALSKPTQKPLFLTQFPTCAPGYGMADDECVACGSPRWPGYQGCITCVNLWTDDSYTTCGGCDTINECIAP